MEGKSSDWLRGPSGPTVCRCCFAEGCYKDISTEYFWMGKREVYAEMLTETLDLNIAYAQASGPNSNSRLICEPCISRLRDASEFKRQVQECEKMFLQYLDPGREGASDLEIVQETLALEKEVKLEHVKQEKGQSDDDFDDRAGFDDDDDDDDDLDDQPLTRLASKVPKKESVDLLDLLDNAKVAEKRKSSTKTKTTPAKKAKTKKETPKATASKPKPEKKKKGNAFEIARQNAEIIVKYATAYPFRLPRHEIVCVFCYERCSQPSYFRRHMNEKHSTFDLRMAFIHGNEGYVKADCTELQCRVCQEVFTDLEEVANHLHVRHSLKLNLDYDLGLQPFMLPKDKVLCAVCKGNFPSLRELSRHMQSHFLKYTCETCGKSYATVTSLKSHLKFSHCVGGRMCRKCRTTFTCSADMNKHIQESSACWAHLCNFCGERFMTWALKGAHVNQVHGFPKNTHHCAECGEIFANGKRYRAHFRAVHSNNNFTCPCCGEKFESKRSLKKHSDNDAYLNAKRNAEIIVKYSTAYPFRLPENSMVCVYCCEGFDDPTLYRKHMGDEHETFKVRMAFVHCSEGFIKADCTDLRCRLCTEPFDTLEAVATHLHLEHDMKLNLNFELGMQPFKLEKDKLACAMCDTKFPCIRQLSRHTQSHFLKHTCDTCGKSYATITTLKNHIRFSHAGNERICRKCRMTFSTLEAKREHLRLSSKCWSHLCMFCGERFMTWTLKQSHLNQVHAAPKRSHPCPECGEVFAERKKYRVHFKISHTDDNFTCTCCGLKFDTKRGLEEHRVVHTKEKLFPCTVCSKSFPRKKNLAQHMWIHSEYKRFECVPCNKQFNQRVSWRTHMKSYHPDLVHFEGKQMQVDRLKVRSMTYLTDFKNT